ncbi:MAG: insulinase family protein, partial [Acidobacteriia bacterium]|nr:insulinase family protein [Terriglobia bacterium]
MRAPSERGVGIPARRAGNHAGIWSLDAGVRLLALLSLAGVAGAQVPPAARKSASPAPARSAPVLNPADLKFPPLRPIQTPHIATFTLPNGMRLFLLEDHELPMVHGAARIRTGNLFDPQDKIGLATVTGMVIRTGGSKTRTGEQWNEELENLAASVESSIGETSGSISFSALKEDADAVLSIFREALTEPEFRQDKVDLAKAQMRSGISRRNDDARGVADREFTNLVYGEDTPYGWQEQYSTIARITRADIQDFYKRYFFPTNVMLAVWGDFDTAAMKTRLEQLFAGWTVEQPPVPPFPAVRTAADPGVYLAVKKDVTQTFFALGQLGGELKDKDYPALEVMADILGGGFQSRLFQRVRTSMGAAYDIGAEWAADYDHPGLFQIAGSTKSVSTVDTIKAIQEEVARIRATEVSEQELKTAKDTALNSLVFAFDTKTKTLGRLLNYEYYGYPKDFIQQYQQALAAVTRADVLRVAKQHLDPAVFTVVVAGNPDAFGQPLSALGQAPRGIDLAIPEASAAPANPATLARGKEILARAQQAVGGADKLAAVKDFTRTTSVEVDPSAPGGGIKALETDQWVSPAALREDMEVSGRRIHSFLNGRSGWIATPEGAGPLSGPQLKQVQGDLFRLYFRLLLSDALEGRTVNAIDQQTVEISTPAGEAAQLTVDPATGLPVRVRYDAVHVAGAPVS